MANDELQRNLTGRQQAALFALMVIAREASNRELHDVAGLAIDGQVRRQLNDAKLVTSRKAGNSYLHELTEDGWDWCLAALERPRPQPSTYPTAVLHAVLNGVGRYLNREDLSISEIFRPDTEAWIRAAYRIARRKPGAPVPLKTIRSHLAGVARENVDAALDRMIEDPDVRLEPETNQKLLSAEDRAAEVLIGGEARHFLQIASV
jgi:hypothetical protein